MSPDPKAQAALALHRFGVGPRAGSIAAIASDPRGALIAELDRPGAGRIANTDLLASGEAARAAFEFQREQRRRGRPSAPRWQAKPASRKPQRNRMRLNNRRPLARHEARRCSRPRGAAAKARSGRAAADLSRRGQGAPRCRARCRDRLRRAAGLVLVEPFLRLRRQGQVRPICGAYEREAIRAHVLGRFADMLLAVEMPSGDADLSRQCALDRSELDRRRAAEARASTKISRARSWSCIRSACAPSTRRTTSRASPT